jgi:uncharacterized membrane protein
LRRVDRLTEDTMILLVLAVASFLVFRFWAQMAALESTIDGLTARVRMLEDWRTAAEAQFVPPAAASKPPARVTPAASSASSASPARAAVEPLVSPPVRPAPQPVLPSAATVVETAAAATLASRSDARDALETRIGSRWLLYIGVVAIVVGVSYFEKLAIDNHWVGETARVIQGGIIGFVLVAAGRRFVRAGYRLYGQILSGCGVAILYVSTYAAFNFYHLITRPVAFALMSGVTALAV